MQQPTSISAILILVPTFAMSQVYECTTDTTMGQLLICVTTDSMVYQYDDSIEILVTAYNLTSDSVTLDFTTSVNQPILLTTSSRSIFAYPFLLPD